MRGRGAQCRDRQCAYFGLLLRIIPALGFAFALAFAFADFGGVDFCLGAGGRSGARVSKASSGRAGGQARRATCGLARPTFGFEVLGFDLPALFLAGFFGAFFAAALLGGIFCGAWVRRRAGRERAVRSGLRRRKWMVSRSD